MKMKKLSEEHYIVVDDSDIKIGDIVAERLLTGKYELFTIQTLNDIDRQTQIKITHSTQPESLGMGWMQSVQPLLLSEVKELLGVVDVEKKAFRYMTTFTDYLSPKEFHCMKEGYVSGYNQALEDNKEKKYTEEDMVDWVMRIIAQYVQGNTNIWNRELLHESLSQRQTEWEVEFVDGKLKLKS